MPDRDRPPQAAGWDGGDPDRSARHPQKEVIERAYRLGEACGLQVWCEDEAGPYQAVPQPGASWQPRGDPARQPHEYLRGGTAKLLTLFRPATGAVRAEPVDRTPNTVLHAWLRRELTAIVATCPLGPGEPPPGSRWADWIDPTLPPWWADGLPPLRVLLIWDNLVGHCDWELEQDLLNLGILPLYTPVAGSWLNLAEAIQRILTRRALAGQHPQTAQEVKTWLAETADGWNADPTPFEWGGKRAARRQRARQRRHAVGGAWGYTRRPLRRCRCAHAPTPQRLLA